MRPVKIANFSGFLGDRSSALAEMVKEAEADVLTGDYLAEVTMSVLATLRDRDPSAGYAQAFVSQLRPVYVDFASGESRIVVNAGGLNPAGLAEAVRDLGRDVGVDVPIATVSGDDLLAHVHTPGFLVAGNREALDLDGFEPRTANAYLGGWGIARALKDGARIVICGRVADASLVVGAAAWWHQWRENDWDQLAGALAAGHIIECGPQATGGNFSGFEQVDLTDPGFPIAEISSDGSSVIGKAAGRTGCVSVATVTAQLVYEIQGRWYANPDVVVDLTSIELQQMDADRVLVRGAVGAPPPSTTKVALTGLGGWENSMLLGVTGLGFEAKRNLVNAALTQRFATDPGISRFQVELLGSESENPRTQNEGTGFIRVLARGDSEGSVGRRFSNSLVELALATYPGFYATTPPGKATRVGTYRSALVRQALLEHVVVDDQGGQVLIDPPSETWDQDESFNGPGADTGVPVRADDTVEVPLGCLLHARSGDKGGNANVGVWVEGEGQWKWLSQWLTTARLRDLVPEARQLVIDRLELPNLHAINFVVRDLLDGGALSSMRLDRQAKGLAEFLRSRKAHVPRSLLASPLS